MKRLLLFVLPLAMGAVHAQENDTVAKKDYGRIYGGFESNAQWYLNDKGRGIAHPEDPVRSNNYLLVNYQIGRFTLINFWASWCAPCVEEMPALDRVSHKFGEHAPIVIGIAMDDPAHVRAFLAAHPVHYLVLIGRMTTLDTSVQLGDVGQVLPYSVLIGADGRISATHESPLNDSQLDRWLKPEQGEH